MGSAGKVYTRGKDQQSEPLVMNRRSSMNCQQNHIKTDKNQESICDLRAFSKNPNSVDDSLVLLCL